jgi:hypothetical protein
MKRLITIVFGCLGAVWAQTSPAPPAASVPSIPDLPAPTVIAVFQDGTKFTMGDLKALYPALPPALQQAVVHDPAELIRELAVIRKFEALAEEKKLDQQSPYKDAIAFSRQWILYQAQIEDMFRSVTVEPSDIFNYYQSHKESFKEVRVKAIYITFTDAESEAQAKAKAAKLVADIRGGADFVKLVKENSEDETSKAKDGDFPTVRASDNIPDAVRTAIFALPQGQTSDPVRQPHGFYIFRAEEVNYRPLSQVRDQVFTELKQAHAQDAIVKLDHEVQVEFPNPAYPPPKASTPAPNAGK